MKKIILFCSLFILSIFLFFNGYKASAANEIIGGSQVGVQTNSMTIDEGLSILGLNPTDFKYKQIITCDENTDISTYFGVNGIKDKTPVEVLGITESYEYTSSSGYIDSYVYLYSPYALDLLGDITPFTSYYSSSAIMFYLNEDKMDATKVCWWLGVKNSYQEMDSVMQEFETTLDRANVTSENEPNSISQGVTRLRFRIYEVEDLQKTRKYHVEKVVYSYENISTMEEITSNCTPSFTSSFSPIKDGNVESDKEYDEEFTDTNIFEVKHKSVVCIEVNNFIYNTKLLWQNKGYCYILLRNRITGEYIDNCNSMQIIYRLKNDKQDRTVIRENLGKKKRFTIGNALSKGGQFMDVSEKQQQHFIDNVVPNISGGYKYSKYPQYLWAWNYKVEKCQTVYVWYEVEAGTIVKGSAYANGLHVEYDNNGKPMGVFDKNGTKLENMKYTEDGVILNEDGTTKLPENSNTDLKYEDEGTGIFDIIGKNDKDKLNLLDKLVLWFKNVVKPFLNKIKWYLIIGGGVLVLGYTIYHFKKKKE